jgi:hypothetical protein
MKALLTNNRFMAIPSASLVACGLVIGYLQRDFMWFSRFGSLLVGIGVVVLARTFIAGTELHTHIGGAESGLNLFARPHYLKLGIEIPEFVYEQERNLTALGWHGYRGLW